jgi:hypothetical protein
MMRLVGICNVLLLGMLPAASAVVSSEVPNVLSYQGVLTDNAGSPVTTATTIRFLLIRGGDDSTVPSTGVVVYGEDANIDPDENGIFSHLIGTGTPAGLCDENGDNMVTEPCTLEPGDFSDGTTPLFLELRIEPAGVDAVLLPRQRIASVGYAMRAATIDGFAIGAGPEEIPTNDGVLNQGLNADLLDGQNADEIVQAARAQLSSLARAKRYIVVTFDDQHVEHYTDYRPVLNARGIKATFSTNSNRVGSAGRMSWEQLQGLVNEGHELSGHSPNHDVLSNKDSGEVFDLLQEELDDVAAVITGKHGRPYVMTTFAYPHNITTTTTDGVPIPRIVQMFHEGARSSTDKFEVRPVGDPYRLGSWFLSSPGAYSSATRLCAEQIHRTCASIIGIHNAGNLSAGDLGVLIDGLMEEGVEFVTLREVSRLLMVDDYRNNLLDNPLGIKHPLTGLPPFWVQRVSDNVNALYDEAGCVTMSDTDGGDDTVRFKITNAVFHRLETPDNSSGTPAYNITRVFFAVSVKTDSLTGTGGARIRLTGATSCESSYQVGTEHRVHFCEGVIPTASFDGAAKAITGTIQLLDVTGGSAKFCRPTMGVQMAGTHNMPT